MEQQAVLFNENSVNLVIANVNDYNDPAELIDDHQWMLQQHHTLVLAIDILDSGFASVSYVVTRDMFEKNNPGITLSDRQFTHVRNV